VDAVGLPTRNTELARDRRSAQTLADESHDFLALDEPLAAGVNALLLGMGDALGLSLEPEVCQKLCGDAKHV
jgi:hypothetical protein